MENHSTRNKLNEELRDKLINFERKSIILLMESDYILILVVVKDNQ